MSEGGLFFLDQSFGQETSKLHLVSMPSLDVPMHPRSVMSAPFLQNRAQTLQCSSRQLHARDSHLDHAELIKLQTHMSVISAARPGTFLLLLPSAGLVMQRGPSA